MTAFDRITSDPAIMNGQPCIRNLRLTVRRVVEAVALYPDRKELFSEYPELEEEDIRQALEFAAAMLDMQAMRQAIEMAYLDTAALHTLENLNDFIDGVPNFAFDDILQGGGAQVIGAQVPLAQMFGYSTVIRSLTQGKAEFTMEFLKYGRVPNNISDDLKKAYQEKRKAENS